MYHHRCVKHLPTTRSGPDSEPTDAELVEACLQGDQLAWAELVRRYERLVYSIPRRQGLDGSAADDVFQETFAALVRQLEGLRNRSGLAKWLITTARRIAMRTKADRTQRAGSAPESVVQVADQSVAAWEHRARVNAALRELGGRCEELLLALHRGADTPAYDVIARQLGIPRGSIGPTRARCLEKLLELLGGDGADDFW